MVRGMFGEADFEDHDVRAFDHLHLVDVGAGQRDSILRRHGSRADEDIGVYRTRCA